MKENFKDTNSNIFPYDRDAAYRYAKKWAFERNPKYYNFDGIGGDCTNFASQILHAGGCAMDYSRWTGWYYTSVNNRAPSWTSVEYLYKFLINNKDKGPIAEECTIDDLEIGDIIQLNFNYDDKFNHSPIVVKIDEPRKPENIFIAAHTYDRFEYPLINYDYDDIRFLHIVGYRI